MRPATEILRTGQWAGEAAFVLGGGPSLKGFDFGCLAGLHTIGINAALWASDPEIWYAGDYWLIELMLKDPRWPSHKAIRVVHGILEEQHRPYDRMGHPECHWLKIAPSHVIWGVSLEEGIAGLNNSGATALNLADVLGADPIFLLGFDMKIRPEGGKLQHWHDEYPAERGSDHSVADRFLACFRRHARHTRARVYNCSLDSALDIFPKRSIDWALTEAKHVRPDGDHPDRGTTPGSGALPAVDGAPALPGRDPVGRCR